MQRAVQRAVQRAACFISFFLGYLSFVVVVGISASASEGACWGRAYLFISLFYKSINI